MQTDHPRPHELVLFKYETAPNALEAALAGLTPSQLKDEAHPGGWSIAEVCHHISDGDDLWKACILASLGPSIPVFALRWYWLHPQGEWAKRWHYAERSVADSLAMFRANRNIVSTTLRRTPEWWSKPVRIEWPHSEATDNAVIEIVESQADHAMSHIDEITQAISEDRGSGGRAA